MKESAERAIPSHALPFLRGVEQGYNVDVRTPLFDQRDRLEVVEEWMSILDDTLYKNGNIVYIFKALMELETAQANKVGPLSVRLPFSDRVADVQAYYNSERPIRTDASEFPIFDELELVARQRLRPTSYEHSASRLPSNTNSGLPLFKRRSDVVQETIALAKSGTLYPALLGWRGQANGTAIPKQRVVWMFPYSTNVMEGRFFEPIHNRLVNVSNFAAWTSQDAVDNAITRMLDASHYLLSSDFSAYDQTLASQQSWYFSLMRNWYQEEFHEDIEVLETNLRNIALVCTDSVTYTGAHGMPSGSNLTNQADSIVNLLAQASSPVVDIDFWPLIQIQGDDAVVPFGDSSELDTHLQHLDDCGFDANPDKQVFSSEVVNYLQRTYFRNYRIDGVNRGIYPTMRALNSLLGQERFYSDWDSDMVSMRVLMILENTKWHPAFEQFVTFVMRKGDKELQTFVAKLTTDPMFNLKVTSKARSIAGLVPTYNQEGRLGGLMDFATVRFIKSL